MKSLGLWFSLLTVVAASAQAASPSSFAPVPVSPGQVDRITGVEARCPTFSWGPVLGPRGQELVILEAGEGVPDLELVTPLVTVELPGSASSWTPAVDQCLLPDRTYAWAIRAVDEKQPSAWSEPRFFRILPAFSLGVDGAPKQQWFGDHLPPNLAAERRFDAEARPSAPGLVGSGIFIEGLSVPAGQELQSAAIDCPAGTLCGTGVFCGNGKVVLGGGANLLPVTGGLVLYSSYPDDLNAPPQMWLVWALNTTGTTSSYNAFAICTTLEGAP